MKVFRCYNSFGFKVVWLIECYGDLTVLTVKLRKLELIHYSFENFKTIIRIKESLVLFCNCTYEQVDFIKPGQLGIPTLHLTFLQCCCSLTKDTQ